MSNSTCFNSKLQTLSIEHEMNIFGFIIARKSLFNHT